MRIGREERQVFCFLWHVYLLIAGGQEKRTIFSFYWHRCSFSPSSLSLWIRNVRVIFSYSQRTIHRNGSVCIHFLDRLSAIMSANMYGTKYNPKDAQIKTWSVQRTLDPLVAQVSDDCVVFPSAKNIDEHFSALYSVDSRSIKTFSFFFFQSNS